MSDNNELSERECEIVRLVATGAGNKQIAQQLNISSNTVKVHLRNIFAKTNVTSRTELTLHAIREGLVQVDGAASDVPTAARAAAFGEAHPEQVPIIVAPDVAEEPAARRIWRYRWLIGSLVVLLIATVIVLAATDLLRPFLPRSATSPPTPDFSRWQVKAALPTARSGVAVAAYENQVYVIGGETLEEVSGKVERYDAASDTWMTLAPKPLPVADVSAVVIGGRIYVPGGRTASGGVTNTLEVFDPRQNRWEQLAPLPMGLSAYAAAAFEGRLYLFGGWDGKADRATVYEYDPSRDIWIERTPMSTAREYAGAAVAGGGIYVIGGYDGGQALSVNELYLPEDEAAGENPWQARTPLPEGRFRMGVASIADVIFIIGGENGTGPLRALDYLPQIDQWEPIGAPVESLWTKPGLAVVGTQIHVLGGLQSEAPTTEHLVYQAIYTVSIPVVK